MAQCLSWRRIGRAIPWAGERFHEQGSGSDEARDSNNRERKVPARWFTDEKRELPDHAMDIRTIRDGKIARTFHMETG